MQEVRDRVGRQVVRRGDGMFRVLGDVGTMLTENCCRSVCGWESGEEVVEQAY